MLLPHAADAAADSILRRFAEQALKRAGGAPLVPGNAARILRDADEHLPAWLAAIESSRRKICVEEEKVTHDAHRFPKLHGCVHGPRRQAALCLMRVVLRPDLAGS